MTPEERAQRLSSSRSCDWGMFVEIASAEIQDAVNERTLECAMVAKLSENPVAAMKARWPEAFEEKQP